MTKKNVFDRFMEKVAPEPSCGCWLWLGAMYRGYGYISAYGRNSRVHRVSWELHKGPIPSGLVVMHKCDNSICVNPDHLMIGTQAENLNDMRIKGRGGYRITRYTLKFYRGSKHRNSKLNEAKVIEIKRRLLNGETQSHLAEVFCISRRSIFSIIKGKTWRHVEAKNISNALIPSYMSGEISVPRVHKEGDANDLGE